MILVKIRYLFSSKPLAAIAHLGISSQDLGCLDNSGGLFFLPFSFAGIAGKRAIKLLILSAKQDGYSAAARCRSRRAIAASARAAAIWARSAATSANRSPSVTVRSSI